MNETNVMLWLTGGILTATCAQAFLAWKQSKAATRQADAADKQVEAANKQVAAAESQAKSADRMSQTEEALTQVTERQLQLQEKVEAAAAAVDVYCRMVGEGIKISNLSNAGLWLELVKVVRESPPTEKEGLVRNCDQIIQPYAELPITLGTDLSKVADGVERVTLRYTIWFVARGKRWELKSPAYRLEFVNPISLLVPGGTIPTIMAFKKAAQVPGSTQTITERAD